MGEDGQDNGQGNNDDGERSENEGGWEKIERPVFAWWLGRVAFFVVGVHVGGCGMFRYQCNQEGRAGQGRSLPVVLKLFLLVLTLTILSTNPLEILLVLDIDKIGV